MSKFKRLSIDEAKEQFPLLNEEANKALKGGCSMCDELRRQYPNIRIYTEDEYDRMCADGTWTVGPVCGIGTNVLGTASVTPESQCDIHMWPFPDRDCEYCYFDRFAYCWEHEVHFNDLHGCSYCYWDGMQYCSSHEQYFKDFDDCPYCCGESYHLYDYSYDSNNYSSNDYSYNFNGSIGDNSSSGNSGSSSESSNEGPTIKANVELINKDNFVGYDVSHDCMAGCRAIMDKYGVGYGDSAHVYRLLYENDDALQHYGTDVDANYTRAIECIDRHLEADRPIIVGVNHTLNYGINEGATDHFIIVTGRGYDETAQQYYYTYIDPGRNQSRAADACSTENNRLYYDSTNHTFQDSSAGASGSRTYDVVQVRPNDGQSLSETVNSRD